MNIDIKKNASLSEYTSWQIGGPADYLFLPQNEDELKEGMLWAHKQQLSVTVLGGGSNVLVSDQGIRGLVICMAQMSGVQISEDKHDLVLRCWAGTKKAELLKIFLKHQLPPALFLAGLPGDVGGGVVMNAGVAEKFLPREFCELVESVKVLKVSAGGGEAEITEKYYAQKDLQWKYRHCDGWQPGIISQVVLRWSLQSDPRILEQVREANKIRLSKQPLDKPSCGSVFKNPESEKAARLIESAGLKGLQKGQAQISTKHANFIVNLGGAKAADVWELITTVKEKVLTQFGIELQTEVIRLGDWAGS